MLQEHADLFVGVDHVRIERQPLTGLTDVEQLLFGHFRSKARLVSPNSMHRHFHIGHYVYEQRKTQTTRIAEPYLCHLPAWQRERVHDLADALCIVLFSLHIEGREAEQQRIQQRKAERQQQHVIVDDTFFEQFKCRPRIAAQQFLAQANKP